MGQKYKYLLVKRNKPTQSKSELYVLQKIPIERYISSCYHKGGTNYEIEYKKKRIIIDIDGDWQKVVNDFLTKIAI
jgi:hypothetical protein